MEPHKGEWTQGRVVRGSGDDSLSSGLVLLRLTVSGAMPPSGWCVAFPVGSDISPGTHSSYCHHIKINGPNKSLQSRPEWATALAANQLYHHSPPFYRCQTITSPKEEYWTSNISQSFAQSSSQQYGLFVDGERLKATERGSISFNIVARLLIPWM